jgi:hypothetical protein
VSFHKIALFAEIKSAGRICAAQFAAHSSAALQLGSLRRARMARLSRERERQASAVVEWPQPALPLQAPESLQIRSVQL